MWDFTYMEHQLFALYCFTVGNMSFCRRIVSYLTQLGFLLTAHFLVQPYLNNAFCGISSIFSFWFQFLFWNLFNIVKLCLITIIHFPWEKWLWEDVLPFIFRVALHELWIWTLEKSRIHAAVNSIERQFSNTIYNTSFDIWSISILYQILLLKMLANSLLYMVTRKLTWKQVKEGPDSLFLVLYVQVT